VGGLSLPTTNLILNLDRRLGVATASASIDDGDMEAVGTAAWASSTATLSKESGSPGGSGAQVLRVVATGGSGYAGQTIANFGPARDVTISGWYRSQDGTGTPRVNIGAVNFTDGTTSTEWKQFSVTGNAAGATQLRLQANGGIGATVEFDNIVVSQVRASDWSSQAPATGPVASQATTASQPLYNSATGLDYDGTDDGLAFAAGLGAHTSHTIVAAIQQETTGVVGYVIDGDNGGARLGVGVDAAGDLFYFDGAVRAGTAPANLGTGVKIVTWVLDSVGGTGIVRLNGAQVDSDSYTTRDWNGTVAVGSRYDGAASYWDGHMRGIVAYSAVKSAADIIRAERFLAAAHGVTLP
jgi:hypothetical protein